MRAFFSREGYEFDIEEGMNETRIYSKGGGVLATIRDRRVYNKYGFVGVLGGCGPLTEPDKIKIGKMLQG